MKNLDGTETTTISPSSNNPGHWERTPALKDTGARVEFSGGALREVYPGKGRHGLMPFNVIADFYDLMGNHEAAAILARLYKFVQTKDGVHLYNILAKMCEFHYGGSVCDMFLDLGIHYEDGAEKYGDRNWEKGLPASQCLDSAARHFFKYCAKCTDEPHHRAFIWNIIAILYMYSVYPDSEFTDI